MPRKRVRDQKKYKSKNPSRMDTLFERIEYLSDPEDIMVEIIDVLKDFDVAPDVGNYYTFIYNAKTPRKLYDQHPLVAVLAVDNWGVVGLNFHWVGLDGADVRNYTWPEVAGYFHKVSNEEIMTMRSIKYAKFLRK
jgi:hypothetical protein